MPEPESTETTGYSEAYLAKLAELAEALDMLIATLARIIEE